MKYLYLSALSILLIPLISQTVYAQNFMGEIGEAFNNLTSGIMGEANNTNQSSGNVSNSSTAGQTANETSDSNSSSINQSGSDQSTEGGIGSFQELQNLTSGNQELLANSTSIGNNVSVLQGMEKSQLGDSIMGNQDAKFEGNALENATNN